MYLFVTFLPYLTLKAFVPGNAQGAQQKDLLVSFIIKYTHIHRDTRLYTLKQEP